MSGRRDEEYYVLKVAQIIKDGLNAKLTAITAEKNDSITLPEVDSNAYYYLTFGQAMPAYDPVVVFSVDVEEGETAGGQSSEQISVGIEMVISDQMVAAGETLFKRIARYRRAIKEVLRDARDKLPRHDLVDLPNIAFTQRESLYHALGVGVRFKFVN